MTDPSDHTQLEAARLVAFRFIGYSARSCAEITRRLTRADFDEAIISRTIEEFKQAGLINDDQFASNWVDDRAERKRYGKRRLAQELSRKGVDSQIISDTLSHVSEEDELRRAQEIVQRRWPQFDPIDHPIEDKAHPECGPVSGSATPGAPIPVTIKEKERIRGYLLRRGFSGSIVKQVVKQVLMLCTKN